MAQFLTRQLTGLFLLALALLAFTFALGHPETLVFDESHYVPAARALLDLSENTNPEHPLFAKEMIAFGIWLFGDNAFGWRILGAVVSALGVYACFQIAIKLFRSLPLAILTALLMTLSITYTVQARTAMLDTYAYPLFAISAAWLMASSSRHIPKAIAIFCLLVGGVFLGLAAASKWIVGIYAFIALAGLVLARFFETMARRRPLLQVLFGRDFRSWPDISLFGCAMIFGLTSLIVYFATFLPLLFVAQDPFSLPELLTFQFDMLDRQTLPLAENSYESEWWEWPLMLEPIWYHFESIDHGGHEAIFYVGNVVVYWGGLVAVVFALLQGLRRQNGVAIAVSLSFLSAWLIYVILPKQIGFFFYYHGCGMLLCFAIASAISLLPRGRLRSGLTALAGIGAIGVFVYFLPVVYALEMPRDQWLSYIWLEGWT